MRKILVALSLTLAACQMHQYGPQRPGDHAVTVSWRGIRCDVTVDGQPIGTGWTSIMHAYQTGNATSYTAGCRRPDTTGVEVWASLAIPGGAAAARGTYSIDSLNPEPIHQPQRIAVVHGVWPTSLASPRPATEWQGTTGVITIDRVEPAVLWARLVMRVSEIKTGAGG